MSKLIVGVDCDGVLRDFDSQIKKLAESEGLIIEDDSEWNYLQKYEINGVPLNKLIWGEKHGRWAQPLFENAPVISGALEAYQQMCKDPRIIINVVTSQKEGTEDYTHRWLSKNKFVIHNKTIVTSEKHLSGVEVIIDDRPHHIKEHIQAGLKGILISRSYNLSWDYQPRTPNLLGAYKWITQNLLTTEKVS